MAATCLHQTAFPALQQSETYLQLISPRKCAKSDDCQFCRSSKPVTYAYGFTGFQKKTFPGQYKTFMRIPIGAFGRNDYFAYRRGE